MAGINYTDYGCMVPRRIAKKFYGNNYIFHKEIKKWVD